jgi:hypothetical protein
MSDDELCEGSSRLKISKRGMAILSTLQIETAVHCAAMKRRSLSRERGLASLKSRLAVSLASKCFG